MKRKEQARQTIEPLSLKDQEVSDDYFPSEVDMPKRPSWDFSMSKEQLELREQKYFTVGNYKSHLCLFIYSFTSSSNKFLFLGIYKRNDKVGLHQLL